MRRGDVIQAVTATGTIEAKEGRYEGFGQRLVIRRARLNFQGAPDNPSLDVLAVREGLPVRGSMLRDGLLTRAQSVSRTGPLQLLDAVARLWSCGKRGPCPVSHSLHSSYDDEDRRP